MILFLQICFKKFSLREKSEKLDYIYLIETIFI